MENTKLQPLQPAGKEGLSGTTLKLVAIAAMLVDHTAGMFVPEYYGPLGTLMHFVGRITGPVMFYFIVEGYHHTRNKNRYTLRMLVFALVSWLPFVYFTTGRTFGSWPEGGEWLRLNVIYTLLLGLLAVRARHEIKNMVLRWAAIGVLVLLSLLGDWNYIGMLMILLFDVFRGSFRQQAAAYSIVVFMQVLSPFSRVAAPFMRGELSLPFADLVHNLAPVVVAAGMFLPLGLLRFYNGQRGGGGPLMKWLFYIFYPAHLLLLVAIKTWLV